MKEAILALTNKKNALIQERDSVLHTAERIEQDFYCASLEYGSELAGSAGTERLHREVDDLDSQIHLLDLGLTDKIYFSDEETDALISQLDLMSRLINSLQDQRDELLIKYQTVAFLRKTAGQ